MVAMQLTDAVVLVTGASAGIGHAAAARFAAQGARVLVHGRDPDRTVAVAGEVGGRALLADLAFPEERLRLAAEAIEVFGRVDVLVNNAGIGHSGPLTEMSFDTIRRLVEVDLLAAIELTRALLPGMLEQGRGAVCFVTSIAGRTGVAGEAVYSATKAGLDAFAESLRAETAGSGVDVSVVVPGVVDTGFFDTRGRPYERKRPRPIPPDAVADAVTRAVASGPHCGGDAARRLTGGCGSSNSGAPAPHAIAGRTGRGEAGTAPRRFDAFAGPAARRRSGVDVGADRRHDARGGRAAAWRAAAADPSRCGRRRGGQGRGQRPNSGCRAGCGSPRPCGRWLPAPTAGLRRASASRCGRVDGSPWPEPR